MNGDIGAQGELERIVEEANRFEALLEDLPGASALPPSEGEAEELVDDARYAARLVATLAAVEPRPHYLSRSRAMLRSRFFGARRARRWRPSLRWTAAPAAAVAAAAAVIAVVVVSGSPAEPLSPAAPSDVALVEPQPGAAAPAGSAAATSAAADPVAPAPPTTPAQTAPPAGSVTSPARAALPTLDEELAQLTAALQRIQENPQNVDPALLRDLTASTASVARTIEREPEAVSPEAVQIYRDAAETGRAVLREITVAPGDEPALEAAQSVAEDGVVVASRYLDSGTATDPTPTPTPEATPEPTPTPEATPEPAGEGS